MCAVWLLSCGMAELPVMSVSLWQSTQPVVLKMLLPFAIDCCPPGSLSDGCGSVRALPDQAGLVGFFRLFRAARAAGYRHQHGFLCRRHDGRSEEHTSELQSL